MEGSELTIGPVCEALGVTRLWLLGSDAPLPETIDLPVSMLVELMDAADALYPTEEQRWRQLRQWLSRLTGRPASEFASAAPLMLAVRRQFRSSRDEDLQAVTVWRRAQPRPADVSQVQLTVRPENAARLRRLAQQLGSEEAALEFLLQMDDHCGKGASLRRTRWPPKVHYESARGQVKIDVGTEMVCVVLSQFKPAPKARPEPPVVVVPATQLPTPAPAPVKPEQAVSTPEEPVHVNGHAATSATAPAAAPPPARPAEGAPPAPLSLGSGYGTVVRDATLPAQMFADDDLAPEQLAEVQDQLTSVLDRLAAGDDSNMASSTGEDATEPAAGKAAETASTASAAGDSGDLAVGDESSASMTVGDDSSSMAAAVEECANMAEVGDDSSNMAAAVEDSGDAAASVEGSGVTLAGGDAEAKVTVEESSADEIGVVAEEMVSAEDMGVVTEDMEIVSKEMPDEAGEMEAVGEMAVASEEVAVEDDVQLEHETVEETVTEEVGTVSVDEMLGGMSDSMEPSEPALRREAGLLSGGETALPEQLVEVPVGQLVELPEQLLTSDGEPEEAAQTAEEAMELGEEVVMEAEEVGQEVDV